DLAVAQGVDAIECDVHLSADGVPVVIHDPTVDRTTNGHGAVANLTLAQLRALDAGGRFGPAVAGAPIPTADELLAWANGRIRVVVELKGTQNPSLVPRTLDLIRQYDVIEDTLVISFDHVALRDVRALVPEILTGALYHARLADPVGVAAACAADAL